MKKFVTVALATAVAGSASFADPNDNEWLELDSEINNLATNLRPARDGHGWSALIRSTYTASFDNAGTGPGDVPDISGFEFDDIDVAFWGGASEYGWRVNVDLDGNTGSGQVALEDAYVFWDCGGFTATMGQFKPRVLRSGYVDPENQLMINRTVLGSKYDFWDLGIQASGSMEDISWMASILNGFGSSGGGDAAPSAFAVRGEFNLGEAASSNNTAALTEGALGGGEELNATIGLAFYLDDTTPGDVWAAFADINGNMGPIGFGAEIGILGDDLVTGTAADFSNLAMPIVLTGDSVPFNVTGSYLVNEQIEIGGRLEILDNDGPAGNDNTVLSVVANYYQSEHSAKWQAQWSHFNGNGSAQDGSIFQIGLVVGGSR